MTPRSQEKLFKKEYAAKLIRIAEGDLQAALALQAANLERKENILFHIHQTVEKALKAALVKKGISVPLVHDLGALIARLPSDLPRSFGFELIALNDYAAIRRYEEGDEIILPREIEDLLDKAKEILEWVKRI